MPSMKMHSLDIYAIVLFLSLPLSSLHFCASGSRLVAGKLLSPGGALISDEGSFALGFFSPSNSTEKHRYVGIWYNNIPEHTVVWVANRAAPITDPSSAALALTSSSNLVLFDGNGLVLWTTAGDDINESSSSSANISSEALLDNTGNLILRSLADGRTVWQSFDHPTDNLLPGMNLRLSHKTQPLQRLVSWRGPQDPSPGDFSYGADPNNLLQRFIWHGSRPHRRSPVWTGDLLGKYMDAFNSTIYMALHRANNEVYMTFGMPVGSSDALIRMEMCYLGKVNLLTWDYNMSVWRPVYIEPAHDCDMYGYCGQYGYCDNTETVPVCKCLDGFQPSDEKEWINRSYSLGCRRREVLMFSTGDSFLAIPSMKVPDKFVYLSNRSFDECTMECRSNFSCVAYAYSNTSIRAIDGDDSMCLVWMGELIDLEKRDQGGENLYIRINTSRGKRRKINTLEVVLPAVSILLILMCIGLILISDFDEKQCSKEFSNRLTREAIKTREDTRTNILADRKVDLEFPFMNFREIAAATENFSESNILGQGGFGYVYKGILVGGKEIAVKRLFKGSCQGVVEFKNEVALVAKLQHRNLAKLLGCCIHGDEKLLIYEYLPNKSLDAFLFNAARKSVLDWTTRFKIIKGVARGLLYLHQDSRLMIIHRDLKASNILLDGEMNPKISDFGTARIFGGIEQQENTNRVVGTFGYMSPEYALEGIISVKSDVYSFGVLLLEIVSGLKISTTGPTRGFLNLIAHVWSLWKDDNVHGLVDSSIVQSCSLGEARRCIHIGLLSVQDNPNSRPLMSSVISSLDNEAIKLPQPKQPVYFAQRNYGTDGGAGESCVNDMSIVTLEGR